MSDKCRWGECVEGLVSTSPAHEIATDASLVGAGLGAVSYKASDDMTPPLGPTPGGRNGGSHSR